MGELPVFVGGGGARNESVVSAFCSTKFMRWQWHLLDIASTFDQFSILFPKAIRSDL